MPNSLRSYAMREPIRASYRLREFASLIRFGGKRCRPSGPTARLKGVHCGPVGATAAAAAGLPRFARGQAYWPCTFCSGRPLRLHGSAALSATAGGPWPPLGLRRSSSLLCLGRASALLSWPVLPPCGPRGPCPIGPPPSSALGSVVVCRSSALWASRGGVVGFAPLGAAGPSGPSPPSVFCRRRPPRSAQCVLSGCGVAYPCRSVKDKRAARTAGRP